MFRNRNDELSDLIKLYLLTESSTFDQLISDSKSIEEHRKIMAEFLRKQIESFSVDIIEGMLEHQLFDFEFIAKLYEFDSKFSEETFRNAITKFYSNIGFDKALLIVRGVKYFLQAIVGYEVIFDQIGRGLKHSKESYELSRKVQEMHSMRIFCELPDEQKNRIINMSKCLPLYVEDLPQTSRLLITNLGNNCYLNMKTVEQNYVRFPVLAFGPLRYSFTIHHDLTENIFEFEGNDDLVLCLVPPLFGGFMNLTFIPPEIVFETKDKAVFSKWKIQYYEKKDPSKEYIIKASKHDVYLCGNPSGNFSYFVQAVRQLDLEDSARFTWKFQCIE